MLREEPKKPIQAARPTVAKVQQLKIPSLAKHRVAPSREASSREASSREAPSREASSREAPSREASSRAAPSREASSREAPSRVAPLAEHRVKPRGWTCGECLHWFPDRDSYVFHMKEHHGRVMTCGNITRADFLWTVSTSI